MYSTRGPTRALPGLCGALLLLGGCGPVYEVRDVLVPPTDPAAHHCIQDCERSARTCSGRCDRAYELCAGEAANEARDTLAATLELHGARQEAYRAKKDLYDRDYREYRESKASLENAYDRAKRRCQSGEAGACLEKKRIKEAKKDLRDDYYGFGGPLGEKPEPPTKPTLASETERIREERCRDDCGCRDQFKTCYLGCGGRIESERHCVKNCD